MSLECSHRLLLLHIRPGRELVVGEELVIRGEEPNSRVTVQDPVSPSSGNADLRFEAPAIRTIVNELRGIVLAGGRNQSETCTDDCLLPPFAEILYIHRRTAHQIHGEAKRGVEQTRPVGLSFGVHHRSPDVAHAIRQRRRETGSASYEVKRVVNAEDWHANSCSRAGDGCGIIKNKVAIEVGIADDHSIRVDWSDDISTRGKVLGRRENRRDYENEKGAYPSERFATTFTLGFPSQSTLIYIRLMMTAVRSSCCRVPFANLRTFW